MSELSLFLKENKTKKANAFFAATNSLADGDGNPLMWEVRALTTREDEDIREECTRFDSTTGRFRLDVGRYMAKVASSAVVEPNLYNASLQNSYDVTTPEDLIREILDDPREYQEFVKFVQRHGAIDVPLSERIETAKN